MTVLKNTRGIVARIRGEPAVPEMIPGGVASRPIPGRVVRTLGGELVVPGMIPSGVVSRPIPGRVVQTLGGELVVPGVIPGGVASRLLCLCQVTFVYNRGVLSRTSDLAAASAWMACRCPSSDGDGVCVAGVSTGMAAGSPSPRPLPDPGLWAAWIVVQEQQIRAARWRQSRA